MQSRDKHAANVLKKGACTNTPVLSTDEIEIFSTIPCFYFGGVVLRLGVGTCLDMRELLGAVVEYVDLVPSENARLVPEALIQYAYQSQPAAACA